MKIPLVDQASHTFTTIFDTAPEAYGCAPGRVEFLGNHTDYNEGYILAAAIDRYTVVCGRAIAAPVRRIHSSHFGVTVECATETIEHCCEHPWADYLLGVVAQLTARGVAIGGFEAVVLSNVPGGAGLSSSAALEVATALFLKEIYPYDMTATDTARLCQAAENQFVGMNCGILDQFSSCMGKADHLIFLDCRDLAKYEHIPLGSDVEIVLANTLAAHELVDGTYNRLRENCFRAADFFRERLPRKISHLRDVTAAELMQYASPMPDDIRRCAEHIIGENDRVLASIDGLRVGDRQRVGAALSASHESSRDSFQNSCEELDAMVACAVGIQGGHGARLSGGGFGGCTINLVDAQHATRYAAELARRYETRTGITPETYVCTAVDGAHSGRA